MLDLGLLPAFLLASVVFVLTPGLDAFLLLRTSLRAGRDAGLRTLLGIHTAGLAQVALVVSGLGIVLAQHPAILTGLRWLGAAYLGYLALSTARTLARSWRTGAVVDTADGPTGGGFAQGFLCNITNPKMMLFCLAFLPQFIGAASSPTAQLALLGAVFTALAAGWELMLVLTASRVAPRLRRPAVHTALEALSATAFLAMSVALAVQ
ncbi:Threonine/homoserine/homoserine lactone efflux protein [Streptoalloteichus tenebrarius]|uniref:Threonine/homoserine/homoserine lactone efflux protein n=1 Tax=Streptoalloteichus tenebrarius (strain ATCC 17920 / DSM 40477 / JCM 4838 / CBS 697.72 / NBRC 16177 / NCIMB 11028 / NRRL B-12390 / A12253. 1 / ISP 5477) TaxID=1933 RepID=A0ABT1HZ35_STRSD|nr:LysE family translocator [Streptoalloteichus tenebrarius]MCP2260754.1 Threonine/homoserine/homoserine lactone efflux protein [Streptoalloteichus tenebrarius]BFF03432.1 LysE family translocator [Streptoalloteichus tenebrarius]